ncbi:MAG: O-antigen ligase family protein [Elusimicrobiota bacterium]
MINEKIGATYDFFLNWGIIILAVSMTFSITLMNISFGFLSLAMLLLIFSGKLRFRSTGLELPLLIFIGFYALSAVLGPDPVHSLKDVSDNYWYILHMYLIIMLFDNKEIDKFVRYLGWSTVIVSVYTILQSLVGLNFNMGFHLGRTIKMVAPELEKVFEIKGLPIYMGTGIMGHHLTFGGQIMMLVFFTYFAFRRRWPVVVAMIAFFFSFAYSAWFGAVVAVIIFLMFVKKRRILAIGIFVLFVTVITAVPGNTDRIAGKWNDRLQIWKTSLEMYALHPVSGIGAGQYTRVFEEEYMERYSGSTDGARCHPHSIYLDMLVEGGVLTFFAFLFFLWKFYSIYGKTPVSGKWRKIHTAGILAFTAVLAAGIFQTYLTDAENSVLIWTLIGLIVRIKMIEHENRRFDIVFNT